MKSFKIPISLIRQHIFCPRIPYFELLYEVKVEKPYWTKIGQDHHKIMQSALKRVNFSRLGIRSKSITPKFNLKLSDENMNYYGVVDCLLITMENVIPVEFKLQGDAISLSHELQLSAYGILAEKIFNKKFETGLIIYGKREKIAICKRNDKVIKVVDEIISNLSLISVPESNAQISKCAQCEFLNYCNDRY